MCKNTTFYPEGTVRNESRRHSGLGRLEGSDGREARPSPFGAAASQQFKVSKMFDLKTEH